MQASSGTYPFESPDATSVETIAGTGQLSEESLLVGDLTFALPASASALANATLDSVRVFYTQAEGKLVALLIVADELFLRYDHLVGAEA
jgi:hypothetical protein